MEQIDRTLKLASGILERNEESIKTLMEALVIIGILMSFAGSSRPASGSEHHLSHFFEITGIIDNTEYLPHGIDVAYSTVITAEIREKILADRFPSKIFRDRREIYESKIKSVYKQAADGCIKLQDKVGNYGNDRINIYLEKETEIRKILEEMPSSKEIYDMLCLVGLDINKFYTLYGKEKINNAILYAKDLKDRYTVLWLNYDLYGDNRNV
jgi:glycerol-1-phosphate dehydrogenase [NAD(P)+]